MRSVEDLMKKSEIELKEGENAKLLGEGSMGPVYRYNYKN